MLRNQASTTSSLVLCSINCNCPDCQVPVEIDDSDKSEASELAEENVAAVPAARGVLTQVLKRPVVADASQHCDGSVKLYLRKKPFKEAYLMKNKKLLVGCSDKRSSNFENIIKGIFKKVQLGEIDTQEQAEHTLLKHISSVTNNQ